MVPGFSTTDLKRWIEENRHLYDPPYKTNRILAHHREFFVLMLHGPNMRLDFHREPGEEFFFQVHGDIELHLKPEGERRRVVNIREGEMFLCPGGLAHSPRRGAGTWGLVIERKRKADEAEEFLWFCERCDEQVLARTITQDSDTGAQVTAIYEAFNADPSLRTCNACGYVFPVAPRAQRLGFLENDKR
jgi:3-hydroxyanthranilate 3,4-dioxygenase